MPNYFLQKKNAYLLKQLSTRRMYRGIIEVLQIKNLCQSFLDVHALEHQDSTQLGESCAHVSYTNV